MAKPVLVKLGGGVITDKQGEASFRKPVARRLLNELQKAGTPAVIVHGAGSFGHPVAARHGIGTKGVRPAGVADVLASVGLLHAQVVALALEVGLPAISVPLHALARREGGLLEVPTAAVVGLVGEGYMPVLCGTLVRDDEHGWSVASGDAVLAALASDWPERPRVCVYATDVDGVYDRHPGEAGARLLDKVHSGAGSGGGAGTDVTGRMAAKVQQAAVAARNAPVLILNGLEKNRLLDALKGKPVAGTWVLADKA